MTTHKANPNSSYGTRYQHTALCSTRGRVGGSGAGSVFLIAKPGETVTCKRCLASKVVVVEPVTTPIINRSTNTVSNAVARIAAFSPLTPSNAAAVAKYSADETNAAQALLVLACEAVFMDLLGDYDPDGDSGDTQDRCEYANMVLHNAQRHLLAAPSTEVAF